MEIFRRVNLPVTSPECIAGFHWLAWNFIGLLPLWGTAILLWLMGEHVSLFGLLKNGEFLLYSASFIAGAMYTIRRDIFPSRSSLTIIFIGLLVVCAMAFAAITVQVLGHLPANIKISRDALADTSIWVFLVSTVLCLLVSIGDFIGAGIDIPNAMKKDERELLKNFDLLLALDKQKGGA
jgi:hypothetical protein